MPDKSPQLALTIEPGKLVVLGHCDCCGHETRMFCGYVHDAGNAHAFYYARYTHGHPEMGVAMAVSIRGWGEGADPSLKECVALHWQCFETGPGCNVLEGAQSPWARDELLGRMLSRTEAMDSGRAQEAFDITDAVWLEDVRLIDAVHGAEGDRTEQ